MNDAKVFVPTEAPFPSNSELLPAVVSKHGKA